MARSKFKITGFARLVIFLLFVAPLAYIGASYYNGQDGIENIKNLFSAGKEKVVNKTSSTETAEPVSTELVDGTVAKLKDENKYLEQKNNELYQEKEKIKQELETTKTELQEVKAQLKAIKAAVGQ